MSCVNCGYCQFPRTANDNDGKCKCKAMRRKTIEVYVCGGETPSWCPLDGRSRQKPEDLTT